jgi:hypothetical protein
MLGASSDYARKGEPSWLGARNGITEDEENRLDLTAAG